MASYAQLLAEAKPGVPDSYEDYTGIVQRYSVLVRKTNRNQSERRFMRLLRVLIEDYDRRHGMPPEDHTPAEILQFLVEHSGKKTSDLLPAFGTRSHVNEAINGKRPISAEQARKLGAIFKVRPGLFI